MNIWYDRVLFVQVENDIEYYLDDTYGYLILIVLWVNCMLLNTIIIQYSSPQYDDNVSMSNHPIAQYNT